MEVIQNGVECHMDRLCSVDRPSAYNSAPGTDRVTGTAQRAPNHSSPFTLHTHSAGAVVWGIRAVARVHLVLGLVAAAFAICVATLHPQLKQQGEGGDCAATDEDAVGMRTDGLLLQLSAGAQAAAATVAAFAPDTWRLSLSWTFTVFAHAVSVRTLFHLVVAFSAAAAVAVGSCPGHLHGHTADLIADSVLLVIPLWVFFLLGISALVLARPW